MGLPVYIIHIESEGGRRTKRETKRVSPKENKNENESEKERNRKNIIHQPDTI